MIVSFAISLKVSMVRRSSQWCVCAAQGGNWAGTSWRTGQHIHGPLSRSSKQYYIIIIWFISFSNQYRIHLLKDFFLLNVFSLYELTPRYLVTNSKMLDVKKHVASGLFTSLESYLQLVCLHIVCLYCRLLKRENTWSNLSSENNHVLLSMASYYYCQLF